MNMNFLKVQINSMKASSTSNVTSARQTLDDYYGDGCKSRKLKADMVVLTEYRENITRLLDKIDEVCSSVVTPEQEAVKIYEKEFSPGGLNSIRDDIVRLLAHIKAILSYPHSAASVVCTGVLKKKSDSPVSSGSSVASNESSISGAPRKMESNTSSIKVQANVLLEVPPGFEQPPQSYLDTPPGFEVAVASTSNVSSTPTDIVQTRDQGSFGVQDGGMSLNLVGREGLSEKTSNVSMSISRGGVMEGRKKYGIFRRPIVRDTGVARSRSYKSNVRGASIVRSCSSVWVTVWYEVGRGLHVYTLFPPFIIMVFDGGGNISSTVVILGGVMNLQHKHLVVQLFFIQWKCSLKPSGVWRLVSNSSPTIKQKKE